MAIEAEPGYVAVLDHVLDWRYAKATVEAIDLPDGPDGAVEVKLSVGRRQGSCRIETRMDLPRVWAKLEELAESLGATGRGCKSRR